MPLLPKASSLPEFHDTSLLVSLPSPSWACSSASAIQVLSPFPSTLCPSGSFVFPWLPDGFPQFSSLLSVPDTITTHFHLDDSQIRSSRISLLVPPDYSFADLPSVSPASLCTYPRDEPASFPLLDIPHNSLPLIPKELNSKIWLNYILPKPCFHS